MSVGFGRNRVSVWRWGLYVFIPGRLHIVIGSGCLHGCRGQHANWKEQRP